ncbi:toprim domain-containing protein [Candidatus Nardonella dryophthoridicola]|uniref:Toprim domain-containing protein n=1 Tax=endosymbiont of Metamasius hemipterus TaxID=204627 RepID=A0ABT0TWK6_9GAMM|nr:toprim domain-containing protein [Candidatus Nardonella dryophthoridicola]MCM0158279.1 toprim domain-containing protein [endosymbiont of Metamasius hemipterus]
MKKKYLYGLYEVIKYYNNNIFKLLIVEGYSDVISLNNNNINYSIAILGTSITLEQIKIIFKNTNIIIFCYDGDKAGKKASIKTLKLILNFITDDKEVKFYFLIIIMIQII